MDFELLSQTVQFGQMSLYSAISIQLIDDSSRQGARQFSLALQPQDGSSVTVGASSSVDIEIVSDDGQFELYS